MNTKLTFTNNIHIHGLNFNDKLSWRLHLKKLKIECQSRMKTIKILPNNTGEADTKNLTKVYKTYIHSLIDDEATIHYSVRQKHLNTLF